MMRMRPIVQLTLGLVVMTLAILLLVHFIFGVFAEPDAALMRARQAGAEVAAAQVTVLLEKNDDALLVATLDRIRERTPDIRSLAVRKADRSVLAHSGDHAQAWDATVKGASTLDHVLVPLSAAGAAWGSFEVAYTPAPTSWLQRQPMWVALIATALLGTFFYYQYMRRALVHLDPKGVIPERVKLAFDIMTDGVVILDGSGRILLANRAFCAIAGREERGVVGERLSDLDWLATVLGGDAAAHPWKRAIATAQPVLGEAIAVHTPTLPHGRLVISCAPVTDGKGTARGCIATFVDFSELHMANERLSQALGELAASRDEIAQKNGELEQLATYDVLTGCLARRAFFEQMDTAHRQARASGAALSCLALDIDRFKAVNDRFGHAMGDRVIEKVGAALRATTRAGDIVGRYGGDEFFVGLPGCSLEEARAVAEALRATVEYECRTAIPELRETAPTVSIGLAVAQASDATLNELVARADRALYDAKAAGRNRVASARPASIPA